MLEYVNLVRVGGFSSSTDCLAELTAKSVDRLRMNPESIQGGIMVRLRRELSRTLVEPSLTF